MMPQLTEQDVERIIWRKLGFLMLAAIIGFITYAVIDGQRKMIESDSRIRAKYQGLPPGENPYGGK
jgi:hypothetical protein